MVPGDGIGPEIAECVEAALEKLRVPIVWERFPHIHGAKNGLPVEDVDEDLVESIKRNRVCFKGTLFTPLSATNTSTQSYNVRLRKALDLHINLVQGFTMPGVPTRHEDVNIVIIPNPAFTQTRPQTPSRYFQLGSKRSSSTHPRC